MSAEYSELKSVLERPVGSVNQMAEVPTESANQMLDVDVPNLGAQQPVVQQPVVQQPVVQQPIHEQFRMRLFDRTVDLSKCTERTGLYSMCRAWVANKPWNSNIESRKQTLPTQRKPNAAELLAKLQSGEIQEITAMPSPENKQIVEKLNTKGTTTELPDDNTEKTLNEKFEEIIVLLALDEDKLMQTPLQEVDKLNSEGKTLELENYAAEKILRDENQETTNLHASEETMIAKSPFQIAENLNTNEKLLELELKETIGMPTPEEVMLPETPLEVAGKLETTDETLDVENATKEELLKAHLIHWKRVKSNCLQNIRRKQERYKLNFMILDSLYKP